MYKSVKRYDIPDIPKTMNTEPDAQFQGNYNEKEKKLDPFNSIY